MKDYFYLQYKMTNRKIKDTGLHPILGYFLGVSIFVLISEYSFLKTDFAKYLVVLACFSLLLKLSEKHRNDFLLNTYGDFTKKNIRIIENLLISIPFAAILTHKSAFLEATALILIAILLAVFTFQTHFNLTIPTPFSKKPFEFSVGFRKTFFIFPIAYTLTIIAIYVHNLNLGIFSMILIFLTALSYFSKPENEYYIWIYSDTPKTFLKHKITSATKNSSLLVLPIIVGLLIFYPKEFELILLFYLIGLLFLWTIILAKYAAYPREMNLPEGILLTFSLYFPPILLATLPFFYKRSIHKLKMLLDDRN